MVICNECGTRISPKITVCPKCSAPVDATNAGPPLRQRRNLPWLAIIVAALVMAGGLYVLYRLV